MERLLNRLPDVFRVTLESQSGIGRCEEIHLRIGQPMEIRIDGMGKLVGHPLSVEDMRILIGALTQHSIYAREEDIKQGFFTLTGGYRVGLTGRYIVEDGKIRALTHIGSVCIRVAREVKGAADPIMKQLLISGRPGNALIVSPPGMGKTTMLRDIARQLSEHGFRVALADERSELAGCIDGVPTVDLGPRTDVADGLEKRRAIPQLLRAMSPDVIITDELGHWEDAQIVYDALRSGVSVIASAHGGSLQDIEKRPALSELICDAVFDPIVVLGGYPGHIVSITHPHGEVIEKCSYGG